MYLHVCSRRQQVMLQQTVQVGHSVGMQLGLECHDTAVVQGALGAIHWHCKSGVLEGSAQGPQVVAGLSACSILKSTSGLRNRLLSSKAMHAPAPNDEQGDMQSAPQQPLQGVTCKCSADSTNGETQW